MRDAAARQGVLKRLGRVAGPGEREHLGGRHAGIKRVGDLPRCPVRLLILVGQAQDPHLSTGAAHRDQRFRGAALVVAHAADRRVEDLGARAEVSPEHDAGVSRVAFGESEDVPRVGVAPAVDQLVVVAAHAHVAVRTGEQVDQRRLRVAGVLELVDEDPSPALAKPRQPVRLLCDQPDGAGEQVVELKRVGAPQLHLALPPHRRDQRRGGMRCRPLVALGPQQQVLRARDLS